MHELTTEISFIKHPKWLTPVNRFAKLFGLMVTPIGHRHTISLSKLLDEIDFVDPMKKKGE